jgi:hypothetical protein
MATTLEHAGDTIENPTDADLARVLEGPRDDDWFLALNRGDDSMEVMIDAGELWVEVTEGDRFVQARSRLDEAVVRSMLESFRDGNERWRDLAMWQEPPPARRQTLKGPLGFIMGLALLIPLFLGLAIFTGNGGWVAVLFALALPGVIAAAAVVKLAEVKRAAAWKKASGRVSVSELATETRHGKEVQVPRIEYEYTIGFHKFVGRRVSLAELIAGSAAKEALARYPVGASVPVYYDPADPSTSVIERDLPAFMHSVWGLVAVMTAAIAFGAWWFLLR